MDRRIIGYTLKDKEVFPVYDIIEWARWFEEVNNRIIRHTDIRNYQVSTVFLGLNHNYGNHHHNPVLFETMIFIDSNNVRIANSLHYQERCCTYDEALQQHEDAINYINEHYMQPLLSPISINSSGRLKINKSYAMVNRLKRR